MSAATASIRIAGANDADAIATLTSALTQRWIVPDCTADGARALLASMRAPAVARRMTDGCRYWVAEAGGTIVGVVALRAPRHLYHLFVADTRQRQGLARRLWHTARTALLAADGPGPVTVNASRNAAAVYARFGFIAEAGERMHEGVPSTPMRWPSIETG